MEDLWISTIFSVGAPRPNVDNLWICAGRTTHTDPLESDGLGFCYCSTPTYRGIRLFWLNGFLELPLGIRAVNERVGNGRAPQGNMLRDGSQILLGRAVSACPVEV